MGFPQQHLRGPGMTRPRVIHLTPALFGRSGLFGGGERYAFELARHMAREVPTIFVGAGDAAFRRVENVVLEYHEDLRPGAREGCRARLERAGFVTSVSPSTNPLHGRIFAWRPA